MIDVLVVGAGPVGTLLACLLLRRGVSVRLIDRLLEPHHCCKATSVQPCSMQMLRDLGLELEGVEIHVANHHAPDGSTVRSAPGKPIGWGVPQYHTEEVLRAELQRLGAQVERGLELTALRQYAERVEAGLGETTVEARYLVGCDGAHSRVRHLMGSAFEGISYTHSFVLADVEIEWELPPDEVHFFLGEWQVAIALPIPGRCRHSLAVLEPGSAHSAETHGLTETVPLERVQELISFFPCPTRLREPRWVSRYRVSRRLADRWREGRIFLAGDAAHVQSPAGGLGMNLGLHDAFNLAWKLEQALRGAGPAGLLDSYQAERRPIAQRMGELSEIVYLEQTERKPRPEDLATIKLRPEYERLEHQYPSSPLHLSPGAGVRVPGPAPMEWTLRSRRASELPPAVRWQEHDEPLSCLVRPDGFLAWVGEDETEAARRCREWEET